MPGGENKRFFYFAVALAVATIIVIVMLRPGDDERAVDDGQPDARDDITSIEPTPQATAKKKKKKATSETTEVPALPGANLAGLGAQPGISGDSDIFSLPKHTITIRLTAPQALGLVAYVIPTSTNHSQGSHVESGRTWSLTTTVYGNPDYAVVYLQAGAGGQPETCEITVDGRVTERRSTDGPYSTMWCQG
ncbi:MAG: hypothetical protein NTX33_12805 [Propionibacteriales bacterium]|nr:hypothetical protein [Propionibacteriales bacterium]